MKLFSESTFIVVVLLVATALSAKADTQKIIFARDAWDLTQWNMVKSWRWSHQGVWLQGAKSISNKVPKDATPQELQSKRVSETFTSMLFKKELRGNSTISSTMEFDYRMAPGIILAADPIETDKGLEYREHYEIILYDKGINVWRHYFENGKQKWIKRAFLTADFKPKTAYKLTAKVQSTKSGAQITLQVGDHIFGYNEPLFPQKYHAGIVISEGIGRFYDFELNSEQ